MNNKTLVKIQEEAVADILALGENGKRASSYGMTLLNKKTRGMRRIRRQYFANAAKLGFPLHMTEVQWSDVKDYALLCASSEE